MNKFDQRVRDEPTDKVDAEFERLRQSLGEQETATSQIPSTRGGIAASGPRDGLTHEPAADEQIDYAIRLIEEHELSMDDSEGLVAMLTELKQLRAAR